MDKNKSDNSKQKNDGMLKEKTNEDFNKQKPNPKDPYQNKKHQIGENEETEKQKRPIEAQAPDAVNTLSKGNKKNNTTPTT